MFSPFLPFLQSASRSPPGGRAGGLPPSTCQAWISTFVTGATPMLATRITSRGVRFPLPFFFFFFSLVSPLRPVLTSLPSLFLGCSLFNPLPFFLSLRLSTGEGVPVSKTDARNYLKIDAGTRRARTGCHRRRRVSPWPTEICGQELRDALFLVSCLTL